MPQMSPLMWLYLFITFSLIMIITMNKIYFSTNKFLEMSTAPSLKTNMKSIKWLW